MLRSMAWLMLVVGCLCQATTASAQGLLFSLPEQDGTWVRYAGTYLNVQERPLSNEGPLELKRFVELTISSVGKEEGEFQGKTVPCRWIEFKLVMGTESAKGIQPGPYGTRLYKVLVPESVVTKKFRDANNLPLEFVPIVQGFRQFGSQPPTPMKEPALAVFPLLALTLYYEELKPAASDESLTLGSLGKVSATHFAGQQSLTSPVSRSMNAGDLWLSDKVPFGWAKYQVKLTREEKDSTAKATEFKKAASIEVVLQAQEQGTGAKSQLGAVTETEETLPTATEEEPEATEPTEEATEAMEGEEAPADEAESTEETPEESGEVMEDEAAPEDVDSTEEAEETTEEPEE